MLASSGGDGGGDGGDGGDGSGRRFAPDAAALQAVEGALSWVPVYPVDVVKTQIQVETGPEGGGVDSSLLGTTRRLWRDGGFLAFWDGIGPKLARAIVNHAVTFYVFDLICAMPMFAQ